MIYKKISVQPDGAGTAVLTCFVKENTAGKPGAKRSAVIICPGGGYEFCSEREAEPVAYQFLAMDCQAFVLNYSVSPAVFPQAVRELAAAAALIRKNAEEWNLNPSRVFVCGFSAGGHLAASLGTFWDRSFVWEGIVNTPEEAGELIRPSGLILSYPVISFGEYGHQGSYEHLTGAGCAPLFTREFLSLETQAGPQLPPVFLWHTCTDGTVPVEGSLIYAAALKKAGVSLELHIFPEGRHGLALASEETGKDEDDGRGPYVEESCRQWIPLVKRWLDFLPVSY